MSILIERAVEQTPEVCDLIEELNDVLGAAYEAQYRRRISPKPDQAWAADHKAEIADHPNTFPPDPVGQMTEGELTGNGDEADETKSPSRFICRKADLDQVFRLVDF